MNNKSQHAGALELENLVKEFRISNTQVVRAVDGVSLSIAPGEFVTLLGPSGCGKTTTLRMLAGFEFPTSGRVRLDGRDITDTPPDSRQMTMVFQSYALFPHLNVFENIAYGLRLKKLRETEIREQVDMVLHLVNMVGAENRPPHQLSGGQQQRVALARALVMKPKVLLFDEPLSNLDAKLRVQMRLELRRLQRRLGVTAVYVTHDQAEAMSLSDRIVVMQAGRVEQVDLPHRIYSHPETVFVADFIGRANFVPAHIDSIDKLDHATVRVLGHQLCLPSPPGSKVNDLVYVVIRPEAIRLGNKSSKSPAQGEVVTMAYLGAVAEYEIEVENQMLFVLEYAPTYLHQEGTPVTIELFEPFVRLLPRKPSTGETSPASAPVQDGK